MRGRERCAAAVAVLGLVGLGAAPARAETPDQAAARLFIEGTTLFEESRFTEGCVKFEESERLDPALGTEFNVADCHERAGRTASAWAMFRKVELGAAAKGKQERADAAKARRLALEPALAKVTLVTRAVAGTPGLTILCDGKPVPAESWDQPVPRDPGDHPVEVTAPQRAPFRGVVRAEATRTTELVLPALVADTTPAGPPDGDKHGSGLRTAAFVVGAVGVAGLAVGGVMGGLSLAKHHAVTAGVAATPGCTPAACSNPQVIQDASTARTFGNASTAAFIVGGAALAGGVALWIAAPSRAPARPAALALRLGPAGVGVEGAW